MVSKTGTVCSVFHCKNYGIQKDARTFHRFPRDKKLCSLWVHVCKRKDLDEICKSEGAEYMNRNYRMCSDHFPISAYNNPNQKSQGLKRGTFPSLNLPGHVNLGAKRKHPKERPFSTKLDPHKKMPVLHKEVSSHSTQGRIEQETGNHLENVLEMSLDIKEPKLFHSQEGTPSENLPELKMELFDGEGVENHSESCQSCVEQDLCLLEIKTEPNDEDSDSSEEVILGPSLTIGNDGLACYQCNICHESFLNQDTLNCHEMLHVDGIEIKPRECPHCSYFTDNVADLERHLRSHTVEKTYTSSQCHKSLAESATLEKHQRSHTKKSYSCTDCPKTYVRISCFLVHMRTHAVETLSPKTQQKTYPMDKHFRCLQCPRTYARSKDLKRHKTFYSGESSTHVRSAPDPLSPNQIYKCMGDDIRERSCSTAASA